MSEKVYFEDRFNKIKVTDKKFIFGSDVYYLSSIAGVSIYRLPKKITLLPKVFMFLGIAFIVFNLLEYPHLSFAGIGIGVVLYLFGLVLFLKKKDDYVLRISTPSGDVDVVIAEKEYLEELAKAIDRAKTEG